MFHVEHYGIAFYLLCYVLVFDHIIFAFSIPFLILVTFSPPLKMGGVLRCRRSILASISNPPYKGELHYAPLPSWSLRARFVLPPAYAGGQCNPLPRRRFASSSSPLHLRRVPYVSPFRRSILASLDLTSSLPHPCENGGGGEYYRPPSSRPLSRRDFLPPPYKGGEYLDIYPRGVYCG